jgi:hypothetical protein
MSQTANSLKGGAPRSDDELRDARAHMRKQINREAEVHRARVRAEYDATGDERRARSARLKTLRMLKEARDRVDERAS